MNPRRKMGKSGIFRFTRRGSCAIISDGCGRGPLRPFRFATHNFIQNHFSVPAGLVCGVKGNQVRVLNDPVTVSGEIRRKIHCAHRHEKERHASTIRKSGNLLKDAAHSFRRKRPARFHLTQFQFILKRPLFGRKAGAFVMYRLSACCPAGPADPAKPSACRIFAARHPDLTMPPRLRPTNGATTHKYRAQCPEKGTIPL